MALFGHSGLVSALIAPFPCKSPYEDPIQQRGKSAFLFFSHSPCGVPLKQDHYEMTLAEFAGLYYFSQCCLSGLDTTRTASPIIKIPCTATAEIHLLVVKVVVTRRREHLAPASPTRCHYTIHWPPRSLCRTPMSFPYRIFN